jgi:DegV family protein with EDD domain
MTIKIVADSTADLPKAVIEKYGITIIPAYINFSDRSYLDGIDITRKEFYEKLPFYENPPTTSAPSESAFSDVYNNLRDKGASEILSIHLSHTLSGLYNVALKASETIENVVVKTFDSGHVSLGTGFVVETAAKMALAGKTMDEIIIKLKDVVERTYTFAAIDTLKFLRRSGRVSRLQASLGSLLQIKPIIKMHNGVVGMEAVRTARSAIERIMELVRSLGPLETLGLLHSNAPEKAETLKQQAIALFPKDQISTYSVDVASVIGSHIGPGAVGFAALAASKES